MVPLAIASGGGRVAVSSTLEACGLLDLFDAVVTVDDTGVGKPDPALFLEAARRLRIEPRACLAFEDTDGGLEAARAAGMSLVDVRLLQSPAKPA